MAPLCLDNRVGPSKKGERDPESPTEQHRSKHVDVTGTMWCNSHLIHPYHSSSWRVPSRFSGAAISLATSVSLLVLLLTLNQTHSIEHRRSDTFMYTYIVCGSQGTFGVHPRVSYVDMDIGAVTLHTRREIRVHKPETLNQTLSIEHISSDASNRTPSTVPS